IQLHSNLAMAEIKRRHALEFRDAIQLVPRHRSGKLRTATLPELSAWGREHPSVPRVGPGTINKQLGALQAVGLWAHDNGLIPAGCRVRPARLKSKLASCELRSGYLRELPDRWLRLRRWPGP